MTESKTKSDRNARHTTSGALAVPSLSTSTYPASRKPTDLIAPCEDLALDCFDFAQLSPSSHYIRISSRKRTSSTESSRIMRCRALLERCRLCESRALL